MTTAPKTRLAACRGVAAVLATFAVGACQTPKYEAYKKPDALVPAQFRSQATPAEAASLADLPWWAVFDDKALQDLVREGLANNYDLQVAVARIEQARALVGVAASEGKPQVGYSGAFGGGREVVQGPASATGVTLGAFEGLLNATWELDLFGRIKHSTAAAESVLLAQEDVRRGVMLSLVSDIAAGYFRLIELDRELVIAKESAGTYSKTAELFRLRFEAGRDSRLGVDRAQAAFEAANSRIAIVERQITQQENALSILVGAPPRDIIRGRILVDQPLPATPVGATTDLLQRRPDILAAQQRMVTANEQIGVAVANFFPRIGLGALAGGQGVILGEGTSVFGVWNAAIAASGPIFTGGRLESQYKERQAFWDETVAQYKKTVVGAFQETSDALVAQQALARQRRAIQAQVEALRRSNDVALDRYDAGRASYFEVLEAQQQLYPAEDALAQTQRDQLVAVVSLYKALGGGWNLQPAQWTSTQ